MALGDGIRRNIATVSQEERDRLRDAIVKLHTDPQFHYPGHRGDTIPGGVSYWFKQDEIHAGSHVHVCPAFLPWHRELVNRFEALIRLVDPQLSLHYWDWTQDPQSLPDGQGGFINLFSTTNLFMGNADGTVNPTTLPETAGGQAGDPWLTAGLYDPNANPFRTDNEFSTTDNPFDPPRDMARSIAGPGAPVTVAQQNALLSATSFAQLDLYMERSTTGDQINNFDGGLHGAAHGWIGGLLGNQHTSFRDPFVYLLHSNVDRMFAMWQRTPGHPERVDPNHVYDFTPGEWLNPGSLAPQDPEAGAGSVTSGAPWWGFKSPMEPWFGGLDSDTTATGQITGLRRVRPWAPPENEQSLPENQKDSRHPTIVFPPSYDTVPHSAYFIFDRGTFSSYEVAASQSYPASNTLIYDGFTPNELGGNPPAPPIFQLTLDSVGGPDATPFITVTAEAPLLENPGPDTPQRITFAIDVQFVDQSIFNSFIDTRFVYLTATHGITVTQASFELTKQPSPYMLDGAISWLSTDIRVFKLAPGGQLNHSSVMQPSPNVAPPAVDENAPLTYINHLLAEMRTPNGNGDQIFNGLDPSEQNSALEGSQTEGNAAIYNYAIAKVRYRANTTPAGHVEVFFRSFATMRSALDYSYTGTNPPSINYTRSGSWPNAVPLLGLIDGEIASIPYFAGSRIDSTASSMTLQTVDSLNVQDIDAAAGQESVMYFGCWLDFNQPTPRFPFNPSGTGPFSGAQPIPALINGLHECLVAEIFFQPSGTDPIPSGSTPASSDRLAQRNLAIIPSGNPGGGATHTVQHTFMLKPSPVPPELNLKTAAVIERRGFDELMIRWNGLPTATKASLYVPEWDVDQVLQLAAMRQHPNVLHKLDAHTLGIDVGDICYVPIPGFVKNSYAGLITLELPLGVRTGEVYRVDLHQYSRLPARFNGAFRITIPVQTDEAMLPGTIRNLALLRYIAQARPKADRWQPIFTRWINGLAAKVQGVGGDPNQVPPSLTDPGTGVIAVPHEKCVTGKVARVLYDCFGDFEGFDLEDCDERHHFASRERGIEEIVLRACCERTRLTVRFSRSRRILGIAIGCSE